METDWLGLWHNLVSANFKLRKIGVLSGYDGRPDPLLDFALQDIGRAESAIDIGAGNGRWTLPLSRIVGKVTAVEPAENMLELLRKNIQSSGIKNIECLPVSWEKAEVPIHEVTICAHGMYSSPDLAAFVKKMEAAASRSCYLEIRLPPDDGIIGELSEIIHGCRHDSSNALIAYSALKSMGIQANIRVEENIDHWVDSSIEGALIRAKRYLRLEAINEYDGLIAGTLKRRLKYSNQVYIWPDGMCSALLWWNPATANGACSGAPAADIGAF